MNQSSSMRHPNRSVRSSPFEAHDVAFERVLGDAARLELVAETDAHEGPVYASDEDALYFTTVPRAGAVPAPGTPEVAIKRLALRGQRFPVAPECISVVCENANAANGMALDPDGQLLVCEQGTRSQHARISRIDRATREVETVVDHWNGMRLNSPNDVVVRSDGSVWFTDPSYGALQGFKGDPLVGDYVYRYDSQSGRLAVVADSFTKPNGLAFSPDESILYIADGGANQEPGSYYVDRPHHIIAFDVSGGRHLLNGRLFAVITPGFPDGIKVDTAGRVYASAFSGVQVFDASGDLIGEIHVPGAVNFAFGGREANILFITTDTAIWAAVLEATGPQRPARSGLRKGA
jgi:gluconolactonase